MPDATPIDAHDERSRKAPLAKVTGELLGLSPWKKKLLGLFLVIASVGGVLWVQATLTTQGQVAVDRSPPVYASGDDATPNAELPRNARGFVDEPDVARPPTEATADDAETTLPWHGRLGGWMARLGISFAVGLVVGVFFRSFLKTMAALTAVAVAAIAAVSYFNVLDVDLTTMRENYGTAAGWAQGQVGAIKDLVVSFLPSTLASGAGFVSGFLKK